MQPRLHVVGPHAVVDGSFTVAHEDVQGGHLVFILVVHELEVDFVVTQL